MGGDETDKIHMPPLLATHLSRMRRVAMFPSASNPAVSMAGADAGRQGLTLVMGNPSADLDSFISAMVLSYFYNNNLGATKDARRRMYVPILNLPSVRSKELWRLRPEFGVALRLATGEKPDNVRQNTGERKSPGDEKSKTKILLEEVLTIADVLDDRGSAFHEVFAAAAANDEYGARTSIEEVKQEVILVDHNSPSIPIPGLSDEVIRSRVDVVGCIDHHVDEGYVPKEADPRVIRTGIGSCTTLVVQHLRDRGLWPASPPNQDNDGLRQVARLALAPILIDTSNLKAQGDKCSDLDREVVRFLESIVMRGSDVDVDAEGQGMTTTTSEKTETGVKWDRDSFHNVLSDTKTNSLDLLTMQEIFDRDYKSWTESTTTTKNPKTINIGVSSLVKPLSWLVRHAGGVEEFLEEVDRFAHDEARKLGMFGMLTRTGDGKKELVLLAMKRDAKGVVDNKFEARAGDELGLETWDEDDGLIKALDQRSATEAPRQKPMAAWKIWWMGDTSKSRKQVGPLVREVTREA